MTVIELGPLLKFTVAVPDPPAESVMLDGETDPALLKSVIVPAHPFRLFTVTENEHFPTWQLMLLGAVTPKSWTV